MQENGRVEAGGWGRERPTALQSSGLWGEKWFLIQPAFSGQIALTTNRVSSFSEQGLMAGKGSPSPPINPGNLKDDRVKARRGQIGSRRLGGQRGPGGTVGWGNGMGEEWKSHLEAEEARTTVHFLSHGSCPSGKSRA